MALAGIVGWIFPLAGDWRFPRIDGRSLAYVWGGGWIGAILAPAWLLSEHGAYQLDRLGQTDWLGMAALLAVILVPVSFLAARRADAHRVLGVVVLGALLASPFSGSLRIVEVNRLEARDPRSIPAAWTTSMACRRPNPPRRPSPPWSR